MEPYIEALIDSLERRFYNLILLAVFGPQAIGDEAENLLNPRALAEKFQPGNQVLQEWASYKQRVWSFPSVYKTYKSDLSDRS